MPPLTFPEIQLIGYTFAYEWILHLANEWFFSCTHTTYLCTHLHTIHRYIGYSMDHQSGLWHSTSIGIFAGVVVIVLLVYTRQRQQSSVWPKAAID